MTAKVTNPLQRIILLTAATFIAWQIIAVNLSDHFVTLAQQGDKGAIDNALFWDGGHPKALTMKARQLIAAGQEGLAEPLLVDSIQANPADARPLVLLAELHRRRGETGLGDQMIGAADRLMPVHDKVQRSIAAYWAERGRLDLAVLHLGKALSANPDFRADVYPALLLVADDAAARQTLAPLAAEPPVWWGSFFHYAIKNARNIDSLRSLMSMRGASVTEPVTEGERNAYINRLRKEGLVSEAYLHWVNGLNAQNLKALGYLFNGSFEVELSNSGFGWYARPPENSGVRINASATYGTEGREALNVRFGGKRVRFNHLYQHLFLAPGSYQLRGRVRPDKLKARRGLRWSVYCSVDSRARLGASDLLLGSGDWRRFAFDILVPPDCGGQILRLHSVGDRDVDHELEGSIWFDDMHIELQKEAAIIP
jgi:tetratricopeptide (TPR) repeat protein